MAARSEAPRAIAGPDQARPDVPPVPLVRAGVPAPSSLQVAWWDDFGVRLGSECRLALEDAVAALRVAGATVERACPEAFDAPRLAALAGEIQVGAASARAAPLHLPRLTFRAAARLVARIDPAATGFVRGYGSTLSTYARAMTARARAIERLESFLAGYDAWLVPTVAVPAFPHLRRGSMLGQLQARLTVDDGSVPLVLAIEAFASPVS